MSIFWKSLTNHMWWQWASLSVLKTNNDSQHLVRSPLSENCLFIVLCVKMEAHLAKQTQPKRLGPLISLIMKKPFWSTPSDGNKATAKTNHHFTAPSSWSLFTAFLHQLLNTWGVRIHSHQYYIPSWTGYSLVTSSLVELIKTECHTLQSITIALQWTTELNLVR